MRTIVKYAFPVPEVPSVPVAGTELAFAVRRIYCVGRNYREHAREMGFEPERDPPFFFTKPADAIVQNGATIRYALGTKNLHHEIELVVAIGREGVDIPRETALEHVYGYAVGVDLTRRDLQLAARDKGRPWDVGKGFDESAPISAVHRAVDVGHPAAGALWLEVNGTLRQKADVSEMIWPVPDVIAFLSRLFVLESGDLIYTGTPAGVGPLEPGDRLRGALEGVDEITLQIAPYETA
ncbi:MAG TPA: fumarylacetoacetate hydrolase family protein [Polyangiaceae bacterium]